MCKNRNEDINTQATDCSPVQPCRTASRRCCHCVGGENSPSPSALHHSQRITLPSPSALATINLRRLLWPTGFLTRVIPREQEIPQTPTTAWRTDHRQATVYTSHNAPLGSSSVLPQPPSVPTTPLVRLTLISRDVLQAHVECVFLLHHNRKRTTHPPPRESVYHLLKSFKFRHGCHIRLRKVS